MSKTRWEKAGELHVMFDPKWEDRFWIVTETLSDGSHVYNVVAKDKTNDNKVTIHCVDYKHAEELIDQLLKAVDMYFEHF